LSSNGGRPAANLPDVPEAERELVLRAQRYEPEALAEAFDRNFDGIYSFVFAAAGDHAQAEELTGQVFVKALDELPRYRDPGPGMTAFLYRLAQSVSGDYLRRTFRGSTTVAEPDGSEPERIRAARQAMSELPDEQLKVIMLRFLAGMDAEEIAHITGFSIARVQSLQQRALKRLHASFARRGMA
jgi:RNA polymerase sigma-70 factor (ECF subfamily)